MLSKSVFKRLMIAALESESLDCDFEIISSTFEDDHSASYAADLTRRPQMRVLIECPFK